MLRGRRGYGPFERFIAWSGLLLMAACLVWLQIIPQPARSVAAIAKPILREGAISRVIIDPGHGGQDSGAMRNGVQEKDLTLDVARRVERLAQAKGFTTIMTRTGDEWISLAKRSAAANRERDCVFVSIHFDEGTRAAATGVQTFYAVRQMQKPGLLRSWLPFIQPAMSEVAPFESQSLAGFVQEALVTRTQAFDRGTRAEQFYVVANVRHPAVLVEGGFLSNNEDLAKLATENYREELAVAITDGIVRYREIASQRQSTLAVGAVPAE